MKKENFLELIVTLNKELLENGEELYHNDIDDSDVKGIMETTLLFEINKKVLVVDKSDLDNIWFYYDRTSVSGVTIDSCYEDLEYIFCLDANIEVLVMDFINPFGFSTFQLLRKRNLIIELKYLSSYWDEMDLNEDVTEYPFEESFDELLIGLEDKSYAYVKDIHMKTIDWIDSLANDSIKRSVIN